jgi:hypothetical protein
VGASTMELSASDWINLAIAAGTGAAAIATAYSARVSARSAQYAARQIELYRDEFRAQTFLSLLSYEREVHFSRHMDVIRALRAEPVSELTSEQRASILVVVNFLNHAAHLIRHRYVVPKQLLLLYAPSIAACHNKLLGKDQWLPTLRSETKEPRYYLHFAKLCQEATIDMIWKGKEDKIDWTTDKYQPPSI